MIEKSNLILNKKTLIISSWAPPKIGGAQNLYNIFSNIDPSSYSILTSEQNLQGKIGKFGSKLDCEYFFYDKKTQNIIIDPELPKNKYYYFIKKNKFIFKVIKNTISLIKFLSLGINLMIKTIKQGKKIIKDRQINLLIGLSDVETNLLSTFILSKTTKTPFTLYMFDLYYKNQLNFPYNIIAKVVEPIIFKNAKHIFVTNDTTKEYYVKKYKQEEKYSIIYNSVFPEEYLKSIPVNQNIDKKKINIVFTGNIYWPQEASLTNLLNLIDKNNLDINITVYCPNPPANLLNKYKDSELIKFTAAQQSEMPKIQSEADILFLPFSWHTSAPDIIKTASPGKLTDYLIAGKPILIHAPEYSFISNYAKKNRFAEVVDEENQDKLKEAIIKIISNKEYSDQLVANARKIFYENHDAHINAEKLTNVINNI
jgi:glycosyltransferase involved in cell wall biosynthesis